MIPQRRNHCHQTMTKEIIIIKTNEKKKRRYAEIFPGRKTKKRTARTIGHLKKWVFSWRNCMDGMNGSWVRLYLPRIGPWELFFHNKSARFFSFRLVGWGNVALELYMTPATKISMQLSSIYSNIPSSKLHLTFTGAVALMLLTLH